jgi:predicted nucleic-acid-binding Zn-ribbon protein
MNEVRKCPKCDGEMEIGYLPGAFSWSKGKSLWRIGESRRIFGHACKKCGYMDFYLDRSVKRKGLSHE